MNAVKVVGGLVEIGAALKFVNTAELAYVTPENAWFDAQVVLTSWVVLAAVCGLYLLGIFRTDHDHDEVKVGPGRLLFGSMFLALALSCRPLSLAARREAWRGIGSSSEFCRPMSVSLADVAAPAGGVALAAAPCPRWRK